MWVYIKARERGESDVGVNEWVSGGKGATADWYEGKHVCLWTEGFLFLFLPFMSIYSLFCVFSLCFIRTIFVPISTYKSVYCISVCLTPDPVLLFLSLPSPSLNPSFYVISYAIIPCLCYSILPSLLLRETEANHWGSRLVFKVSLLLTVQHIITY